MSSERRMFCIIMTISIVSISTSNAAPYDPELEIKPWVQEDVPTPIITQPCLPGERCWEWLPPIARDQDDAYLFQDAKPSNNPRLQDQRKIHREVNSGLEQLKEDSAVLITAARSPSPIIRQISPRPVKKDVFMSRSWGPGGLPFSVLYMNPHSARANQPNAGVAEVVKAREGATPEPNAGRAFEAPPAVAATMPPPKQPNYRVALRNGASGQPRRQYSIIPQLFISYGWGPLGK